MAPSNSSPPSARYGLAWAAASALLFALMGFFARLASESAHWALVAAMRTAVGALLAYLVGRARGVPLVVRDRQGIWLRSAFGTASLLCTFAAFGSPTISLGDVSTLVNLTPIFVALLAPFVLRERIERRIAIALPLSVTGVVLVLHPTFLFGGARKDAVFLLAGSIAASASFFSALAMMMLRKISQKESPEAISLHFSLVATAASVLFALPHLSLPSLRDTTFMVAAGVSAGIAQLAMTRAYALDRAARVSSLNYLAVVASALLGALALREVPGKDALLGMALVIAGGLVITLAGWTRAR